MTFSKSIEIIFEHFNKWCHLILYCEDGEIENEHLLSLEFQFLLINSLDFVRINFPLLFYYIGQKSSLPNSARLKFSICLTKKRANYKLYLYYILFDFQDFSLTNIVLDYSWYFARLCETINMFFFLHLILSLDL